MTTSPQPNHQRAALAIPADYDVENERLTIIKKYRELLKTAGPVLKEGDEKEIRKAFEFAVEAHKTMRRKSGEPYIYHPIAVAMIVVDEIGLGTTSIVAALLHDVVEDTHYTLEDIERQFGTKVAKIIDGLTKITTTVEKGTSNDPQRPLSMQSENFRKMLLTISEDIRVVLVKIADRLHNMRTLESMSKTSQLKIKAETEFLYAPLAHRLGLYTIKSELEDLCLKFADTEAYNYIQKRLTETQAARDRFTKSFVKPIEEQLRKNGLDFVIKSRTKSVHSIYQKMKKQNVTFDEVYDLFAIRIIFKTYNRDLEKELCWKIYSIITDHYTPSPNRLRDWISVPKENGYESLHTTVMSKQGTWVEVQIRSDRMDDIAERGYAAHWKYKQGNAPQSAEIGIDQWLVRVRELLENKEMNTMEFIEDFKANLYREEVYVFTPKGDMKVMPYGASVLDFAFDIHSQVGLTAMAAKISGKIVPLNYQIQSGEQISIITSPKAKPNDGWLRYVVTSKAKAKIKEYLKEERRKIQQDGKEIITRKLAQLKLPFNDKTINELKNYFNLKTETDLFYYVGIGKIEHTAIKKFRDSAQKTNTPEAKPKSPLADNPALNPGAEYFRKIQTDDPKVLRQLWEENPEAFKRLKKQENDLIIGESTSVEFSFAPCCQPIYGDDIFGFSTTTNGIRIHRRSCPNINSLLAQYGDRLTRVKWAHTPNYEREYEVRLLVEGTDRRGIVSDVTKIISNQMRVTLLSISFSTNGGTSVFSGKMDIAVHDKKEFDELVHKLENVEGILRVIRYDEALNE